VVQDVTGWDDAAPQGWILKALREAGSSLISEMRGLSRRGAATPSASEPTLAETIAHLVAAERLAQEQITAILEGSPGPIPVRDIEAPAGEDALPAGLADGLIRLESLRARTIRLLWSLGSDDWQRRGRHPYRGEVTPVQIARELAHHDLEHLWQVRGLRPGGDSDGPS